MKKKKNNKMFLALAVVAALAMVSVAGVALQSDDSDAAALLMPMGNGDNSTTIIEDTSVDATFYINLDASQPNGAQEYGVQYVKIKEGLAVTGTISIGTADNSKGENYKEYATIKLDGVKNAVFTLIMAPEVNNVFVGMILVGDEATVDLGAADVKDVIKDYKPVEGTVELTKGWLMGGAIRPDTDITSADWPTIMNDGDFDIPALYSVGWSKGTIAPFTGTMKAGSSVVESAYTAGLALGIVDGKATIFNQVIANDLFIPVVEDEDGGPDKPMVDRSDMFVKFVSGEFSVAYPENLSWSSMYGGATFSVANVNMIVEEAATIYVGDNMPSVANVTVEVPDSDAAVGDILYLIPESGVAISATGVAGSDNNILFTFANPVKLNTDYRIVGALDGKAYYGTFSVEGSDVDYAVFVGGNEADSAVTTDTGLDFANGEVTYDSTYSFCMFAASLTKGIILDTPSDSGKVKATSADSIVMLMADNVTGNYLLYIGTVGSPMQDNRITDDTAKSEAVISEEEIDLESIENELFLFQAWSDDGDYTLTIKGNIVCVYTSSDILGKFSSSNDGTTSGKSFAINFEGTGMLTYGDRPVAKPTTHPLNGVSNVNAAYYYVNEGPATKPTSTTFYYTTLNNALTQSNNITILGTVILRDDTTLVGPVSDEDTLINISSNARLQIGQKADKSAGITEASPKVSVPSSTTVTKLGSATYEVVSGQAIYDVKPTKAVNEPKSDVLLEGDKFIYTDLWTAFDISQSGQTIVIRAGSTPVLSKDATLKEGVTLDDKNAALKVNEKITFTVNGTYECQNALEINGTMRVNGTVNFTNAGKAASITATGAIDIMSSGVVNVGTTATAGVLNSDPEGVITVRGALNVPNASSTAEAGDLIITGSVSVNNSNLFAITSMTVGVMPEVATKAYTNPAKIEGKIDVTSAICTTYGDFALTATGSSANVVAGAGFKGVKYMIGEVLFCTMYSDSGDLIVVVNGDFKDIILTDWNNDIPPKGDSLKAELKGASPPTIGTVGWETVYAVFEYRTYNVIFEYMPGFTWTCNGQTVSTSAPTVVNYGDVITVNYFIAEGYAGTPILTMNGNAYKAGDSVTVTSDLTFKATGVHVAGPTDPSGWTLIETLLVIIVIIILVMAILVAIRLLRS